MLISFTNNHKIFEKFQSGFCSLHSSDTALVKVTSYLLLVNDSGLNSILILLASPSCSSLLWVRPGVYYGSPFITIHMLPLGQIMCRPNIDFHSYRDDMQLYALINPGPTDNLLCPALLKL